MDQVFGLPPGHPLLAAPPPGVSVRVLGDGGAACRQPDDGTIRVEVSETVTIITDLLDPVAYPARDIAELYGMRWASEMVFTQLAKRAVRPLRRGREHVADLGFAAGGEDAAGEQPGRRPAAVARGGRRPAACGRPSRPCPGGARA